LITNDIPGQYRSLPRAWGVAPVCGIIRSSADDFQVEEQLGFEPEGEGEHLFLLLEKRALNTADVVRTLSRWASVPQKDIGFCGLKDKHAVTRQWFSIGLAGRADPDIGALQNEQLAVLQSRRHRRKLRRGVHRGNRFRLIVRHCEGDRELLEQRLGQVQQAGTPNYFGEQRFGIAGNNLQSAERWVQDSSRKPQRQQRSMWLSALRSWLFNALLAERVATGRWTEPQAGEACMLNGSNSVFACEAVDAVLRQRAQECDLHPVLPLWGTGQTLLAQEAQARQQQLLADYSPWLRFLEERQLEWGWRATRSCPDDFCWQFCDDETLKLEFTLAPGSYATVVLRELVDYRDATSKGKIISEGA